jgi:hypothetical protein
MIILGHEDLIPKRLYVWDERYVDPASVKTGHLNVVGMQVKGFNDSGEEKIKDAFRILEIAVNSEEFKERVLNFVNDKGEREFASNNGKTNEEIYQIFMEGRELLQEDTPGEMNFYLKQYYRPWSRVIGYTNGDTNVININYRFFKNYMPYDVAANLAHEWTHKIGFDHKSAQEHDSAPYAIGYILGDIAEKIYKEGSKLH